VHNQGILCTDVLKIISKYKGSFYAENFPKTVQGVLKSQRTNEMVGDIVHYCAVLRPEIEMGTMGERFTRDVTGCVCRKKSRVSPPSSDRLLP